MFTIRPYRGSDEAALIQLWNLCLTHDPINAPTFRTKVLLDPNFDPNKMCLAEEDGQIIGFVLGLTRRVPLFLQGLEEDSAWITAFGVHPDFRQQGVGKSLFSALYSLLTAENRKIIQVSPYVPNYFTPGIDANAYPGAIEFLQHFGWVVTSRPISMKANLTGFTIPPAILALEEERKREGFEIREVTSADIPELMEFIIQYFGWDWYRFAQEYLLELFGPGSDQICLLVALQEGKIVGYCQQRRERFGPFGVNPNLRSKGIGRILLFHCLQSMFAKGFHSSWFLWTGADAARLYSLAGFEQVRQFVILKKETPF